MSNLDYSSASPSQILNAVSNPDRVAVFHALAENGELNVTNIAFHGNWSQSAASQHLAVLRKAGILKTRRDQQTIYYSLNDCRVLDCIKAAEREFGK